MSVHTILNEAAKKASWSTQEQLNIVSEYIDNQRSEEAFYDFETAYIEENPEYDAANEVDMLELFLEYIRRQDSDAAFADFIAEALLAEVDPS